MGITRIFCSILVLKFKALFVPSRLLTSLPLYTQRLLVLLFGTFRVIATNSEQCSTGMSAEALGVSVAPSFFQSCVSDGKTARMEDVMRFKVSLSFLTCTLHPPPDPLNSFTIFIPIEHNQTFNDWQSCSKFFLALDPRDL